MDNKNRIVKSSAGIACCRYNNSRMCYEIIMIRKRCTYSYITFILGCYSAKSDDDSWVRDLFKQMTTAEKLDILSLKFEQMWYRMCLTVYNYTDVNGPRVSKSDINSYMKKKAKFESCFAGDGGRKLRTLMNNTSCGALLWEIPKGRKSKNEMTIDCAIREFREESGVPKYKYTIIPYISPISESHSNMNITYETRYFVADADPSVQARLNFNSGSQTHEVDDVAWMGLDDIRNIDPHGSNGRLYRSIKRIFNIYKRYKKGQLPPVA